MYTVKDHIMFLEGLVKEGKHVDSFKLQIRYLTEMQKRMERLENK